MPVCTAGSAREGRADRTTTFFFARALAPVLAPAAALAIWTAPAPAHATSVEGDPAAPAPPPAAAVDEPPVPAAPVASPPDLVHESVVRASRVASDVAREDPAASSSVVAPSGSPRARDDLGTLLLEVPGADVTRRGGFGAITTLSLRGSNPDEVRIFVDGVPMNQAVGGAVDLSTLPLGDVERVEVYRGSSPLAFGQSALGGVVSIVTRTPGAGAASARAGGGSFRTTFADATAGGAAGRLKLYGGLHALRAVGDFPVDTTDVSAGFQAPVRQNNDMAQLDGVARAALALPGRRELRAGFIGVWRDQGVPAEDNFQSLAARASTTRLLAHVGYESRDDLGASSRLRAVGYASSDWESFSDPLRKVVGVVTATRDRTQALGVTTTAEKALGGWARGTALLDGRFERYLPHNDADPTMPAGFPAERQVLVTGVEIDAHLAAIDLHLLPSARIEASRDVRTGRDLLFGTHLPPSPPIDRLLPVLRLGVLRPLGGGASLRANLGHYARIPTFLELYGYNRGVIGNPQLLPESGTNADLGVTFDRLSDRPAGSEGASGGGGGRAAGVRLAVTAFGAVVDDLIDWQPGAYQTRAENVARARILGIECELRLRFRRLTLVAQGTLNDARDRGDMAARWDRQLAHHPRQRGYARAEWARPLGSSGVTAAAYFDLEGLSGNSWATGAYGGLPPRLLAGAGLSVAAARLRLTATAFNLGDSRIQDFPGYPQPGRSLFVALGWSSAPPFPSTD